MQFPALIFYKIGIMGFGFNEILLVLIIVLLFFGAKKIPDLMRGLGKGMREFNHAKNENTEKEHKTRAATDNQTIVTDTTP